MTRDRAAFAWKPMPTPGTEHLVGVGKSRCFIVQKIDGLVRVTSGHRVERARTAALQTGGTILVPLDSLDALIRMLRHAAQSE